MTVEPPDDAGCHILHVDMDAFFASVEVAKRPELRDKPVIVGGLGPRGVVAAASYPARVFGVHSALPMAIARRRCPHAVFLVPDGKEYARVSAAVMALFAEFTPLVEPLSVDEAFLDVSGARRLFGAPTRIAAEIRRRVRAEHDITCTIGVASTKFVAKLASTQAKPDGLRVVPSDGVDEFLHPLPITALWGVGEKTARALSRLGLRTVADIAAMSPARLSVTVGKSAARHLHDLANGRDPRRVTVGRHDKSIGAEVTFDIDVTDRSRLLAEVLRLSHKVAARARRAGVRGHTVTVKIRSAEFVTINRSNTLAAPTDTGHEIYVTASRLVTENAGAAVRLIGVRLEGLTNPGQTGYQPVLGAGNDGWRDAERVGDELAERFGTAVVRPATLLTEDG